MNGVADLIKAFAEIIKALAHFAWPGVVALIVCLQRDPIGNFIARLLELDVSKDKGLQILFAKGLDRVKKTFLAEGGPELSVEVYNKLEELRSIGSTDPRKAILECKEWTHKAIIDAAQSQGYKLPQDSSEDGYMTALTHLRQEEQISPVTYQASLNLVRIRVNLENTPNFKPKASDVDDFV